MVVYFPCVYSAPSVACSINTAALLTLSLCCLSCPCAVRPGPGGVGGSTPTCCEHAPGVGFVFNLEDGDCFPGGPGVTFPAPVTIRRLAGL